jgi:type II restriction enzyme
MPSPAADAAAEAALRAGRAMLKHISRNDVGDTGGHQCGYYLPKHAWWLFSPNPPDKGLNHEHAVRVLWGNGLETNSRCKWYGRGTRSEYRLTRFGKGFPFLTRENVGDLLALVPESYDRYRAWVLSADDDIESLKVTLGVDLVSGCAVFQRGGLPPTETADDCIDRVCREFAEGEVDFPAAQVMSETARNACSACLKSLLSRSPDDVLLKWVEVEYRLFRMLEEKVASPAIAQGFRNIDHFLTAAQSILQRRKARAGLSLQNHVDHLLKTSRIPFERDVPVPGKPDLVIPGKAEYDDPLFPDNRLFVVGIKTTCKDRWRQVLEEGPRLSTKHLLTLQPGISESQLRLMHGSGIQLVVPKPLHKDYLAPEGMVIWTIDRFLAEMRTALQL